MDKLVDFLASKIGYTLVVILGFIVPGIMFVFVWNKELYMELDIVKLLLLSFGISFLLFIPMFVICMQIMMIGEKIGKLKIDVVLMIFLPTAMNVLWMMLLMAIKVLNNKYTVLDFAKEFLPLLIGIPMLIFVADFLLEAIFKMVKKIKRVGSKMGSNMHIGTKKLK